MKTNEMTMSLEMPDPHLEEKLEMVVNTGDSNPLDEPVGETETLNVSPPHTVDDETFKTHREKIIARGVHSGIPAAVAMAEIRGHKNGLLWKTDFSTFEAYCRKKWDLGRSHTKSNK